MVKISELPPFDPAVHLETPEDRAEFLSAILENGEADDILRGLRTVARSMGQEGGAEASEILRGRLGESLGESGHPEFATVVDVMRAMGIGLSAVALSSTLD